MRVTVNECRSLFRRPWRRVEDIEAYAVATSGFFQRVFGDHGLGERSEWGFTTSSGEAYGFTREFSDAASEGVVEDLEAAVEEVREFVLTPTA